MYRGEKVYIRKMVHEDAPVVLEWENNPENWLISDGDGPYVLEDILDLVNNIEDVQSSCQVRYIIFENETNRPLGTVDLFNIDFRSGTAGVGILIAEKPDRKKGLGKESVLLVEQVADQYGITRIEATVHKENTASRSLFRSCAYEFLKEESIDSPEGSGYIQKLVFEKCLRS